MKNDEWDEQILRL